jgi:hypothetical protein
VKRRSVGEEIETAGLRFMPLRENTMRKKRKVVNQRSMHI